MEFHLLVYQKDTKRCTQINIAVRWKPPDRGLYKLNIDGAAKNNLGMWGTGGVFKNHVGQWILGFSESTPRTNPAMTELQILRRGLHIRVEHNFKIRDSFNIIKWVNSNFLPYSNLLFECRSLMTKLDMHILTQTYREQNRVADKFAKKGLQRNIFDAANIFIEPPTYSY